jgi:hypothetical protein
MAFNISYMCNAIGASHVTPGRKRLRMRPVAGSREHGNETSGSIKGGEFLNHVRDY